MERVAYVAEQCLLSSRVFKFLFLHSYISITLGAKKGTIISIFVNVKQYLALRIITGTFFSYLIFLCFFSTLVCGGIPSIV